MPNFVAAIRTNKIPVIGLTPETSGTAPTSPVAGQFWTDTSVTPNRVRYWNGSAWIAADGSSVTIGTTAGTVAAGDDARIVGAQQTSAKNAANGYAGLDASTKIAFAQLPTGTTSTTVAVGNDARFTDARTPIDASVTGGPAGAGVKLAANTITHDNVAAANKDGVAATPSMRTLGTGAQQALAGNTRLDQLAAPTAAVALNSQRITGLGAPSAASDAARLADVQAAQAGIDAKPSARAATTANITLSGTQTIDGVAVIAGDRVLVKNQTDATQNGPYVVAAGAWSRATDEVTANSFWFVEEGTTNGDTQWVVSNNGTITLGTTALTLVQFGGATAYSGTSNRITVSGTSIDIAATYAGQTSITTLGTIATGTWQGTAVGLGYGGTGATTAAAARTNLNVPQRGYAADLGAVSAGTPVTITHSLGTQDVIVQIRETATNAVVEGDIVNSSTTAVAFTSGVAYASGALRAVVLPVS